MLDILRGFVPWILYFVFSNPEKTRLGAGLALAALLVLKWRGLAGRKILDWVGLLFFLFLIGALSLGGAEVVARYAFVASGLTLALTAFGSVALGTPFTLQYARESVPKEYQSSPIFWTVNKVISIVWGLSFALQTVLVLLYLDHIGSATVMNEILPNRLTVGAAVFTARYPDWYTARVLKAEPVADEEEKNSRGG